MNPGVIGCGYVGLVSATGSAQFALYVVAAESDAARLTFLEKGRPLFHDPYLPRLLRKHTGAMWTKDTGSSLGSATQRLVAPIS